MEPGLAQMCRKNGKTDADCVGCFNLVEKELVEEQLELDRKTSKAVNSNLKSKYCL